MLVAAAVLFYVSYWLVSRFEAKRWTDYLAERTGAASRWAGRGRWRSRRFWRSIAKGPRPPSCTRRCWEARGERARGSWAWRPASRWCGAFWRSIAAIVRATSVRLPMQLFFKLSGLFLFVLAIVFAGNGVFELQNAGILVTTNLTWMGHGLPWAGLFPNLQVLSVQGLLLFGAVAAWLVVPRSALGLECGPIPQASNSRRSAAETTRRGGSQCRSGGSVRAWSRVILASVVIFLALNLNWKGTERAAQAVGQPSLRLLEIRRSSHRPPAGFREYPIGDEVEKNQIRIAAVYLPPVEMDGMPGTGSSSLIHLEADIHATEGNRNGFAKDEFVPYLVVRLCDRTAGWRPGQSS